MSRQPEHHADGSAVGQINVELDISTRIGVAINAHAAHFGPRDERIGHRLKHRKRVRQNRRARGRKMDRLQDSKTLRVHLNEGWAAIARGVRVGRTGFVWAVIVHIRDVISVAIVKWTTCVKRIGVGSGGFLHAVVCVINDKITVLIPIGAARTRRIWSRTSGSAGA